MCFFLGHGSGICLERELVQFMIRTVFGRPWTFGELKKKIHGIPNDASCVLTIRLYTLW